MSRKGFTPKNVDRSPILRALSGNLELIRRMEDLTMTEFAKMVGVSDRFLNELKRPMSASWCSNRSPPD
jgi:DNA-binding transcriptional regulator YiaG